MYPICRSILLITKKEGTIDIFLFFFIDVDMWITVSYASFIFRYKALGALCSSA
jgi:hypothetical protein